MLFLSGSSPATKIRKNKPASATSRKEKRVSLPRALSLSPVLTARLEKEKKEITGLAVKAGENKARRDEEVTSP